MTSQKPTNKNKSQVKQNSLGPPFNNSSLDAIVESPANFIEIQEMHVQKPKHSRETLQPKTAQK